MKRMRSTLLLLLLAGAWTARALGCRDVDCSAARCDPRVSEHSCAGEFRRNGADCWCCDACVPYADEGASCPTAVVIGVAPDAVCRPPLQCVEGICWRPRRP
ncbi:fungal protease inhibitor-1-like isoform X2 [Bacillus rossius redtenbacheri]|uniref:fungal protease inhibitor-1-like isoform X2 n=1 Tax=Bacillus rossius redtenbacheri TaxID=93214 RepID=UPI002FDDD5C5